MDTVYVFSVATQTAYGRVEPVALANEIAAANLASAALDTVQTSADVLSVAFVGALSAGDQAALAAVVAAHKGAVPPSALPFPLVQAYQPTGTTVAVPDGLCLLTVRRLTRAGTARTINHGRRIGMR